MSLEYYEQKALKVISKYTSFHKNIFVDISGGRCSTVALHLTMRASNHVTALYIDTTQSLPESKEYVRSICKQFGVKLIILRRMDVDFWSVVTKRGFPRRRLRWCMKEFKSIPLRLFNLYLSNYVSSSNILHITGTTINESSERRKIYALRGLYHYNNHICSFVLHPILDWRKEVVIEYLKKYGIPECPTYKLYGTDGGCYYCPFIRDVKYYKLLKERHPELFQRIVLAEKSMRNKSAAVYLGVGRKLYLSRLV